MAVFSPKVTVKADGEPLFSDLRCDNISFTPGGGEVTKYEVTIAPSSGTRILQAVCVIQTVFAMAFLLSMQMGCNANANAITGTVVAGEFTTNAPEDVAAYLCEDILAIINPITDGPDWPFTE